MGTQYLIPHFLFFCFWSSSWLFFNLKKKNSCCYCSVTKLCLTLCNPMDCSMPGFPSLTICPLSQWCNPTVSSCCPLLLLPSIFPSIRVFSNELAVSIMWPKYWSFCFSISPSNKYSGLTSFKIDWLDLQGSSWRVFSSTTVWKHQFFGALPSLWSSSHISTWLLEGPQPWLYGPSSAKWCLCFLICCLGLSYLSCQEAITF